MTGRRSVWSDQRVIDATKQFALATDEVWRLQNGKDPECKTFIRMANKGHYRRQFSQTKQGFYVCTASGEFLSSGNSNHPDRILKIMAEGLKKWEALGDSAQSLPPEYRPKHRWEDSFPEDGLALTMFTRDLPTQCDPNEPCSARWNQDPIWFSKAEARMWLPADLTQVGEPHEVPRLIVDRLARYHLTDTVNGQTSSFSEREVRNSKLTTQVVSTSGQKVRIKIQGTLHSESRRARRHVTPHGVKTELLGEATYDVGQSKFVEFEFVALGNRWGRTTFNGRRKKLEKSPVGFAVGLTPKDAPIIAPAMIGEYRVKWVKKR